MLIEAEVRDSQILDWLCRQQENLAVDIEFSHRTSDKEYTALPLHIQSFTKTAKVMKPIAKDSREFDEKPDMESIRSDSRDSFVKKRSRTDLSTESKSVTTSSSRAGEWYPKDLADNRVKHGKTVKLGQPIDFLQDSNDLLESNNINGMWRKFEEDGFLYFRDFLNREEVLEARELVLDNLRSMNHIDDQDNVLSPNGWTIDCGNGAMIGGSNKYSDGTKDQKWKKICQTKAITNVITNDRISKVLQMLQVGMERNLKLPVAAHEFRHNFGFLRVKGPKEYTAEHADIFYFRNETEMFNYEHRRCFFSSNKEGEYCEVCHKTNRDESALFRCEECQRYYHVHCVRSKSAASSMETPRKGFVWHCADCLPQHNFGTCWIPLGDIEVEEGVLALLPHSYDLPNFYLNIDNTQLPKSYFTHAKGRTWLTGPYSAGDVVFFDSRLIHCTSKNYRNSYRLSLDVRWDLVPLRDNVWTTEVGKFIKKYATRVPPVFNNSASTKGSSSSSSSSSAGGNLAVAKQSTSASATAKRPAYQSDSDDTFHSDSEENEDDSDEYTDDVALSMKQKKQRRDEKQMVKKRLKLETKASVGSSSGWVERGVSSSSGGKAAGGTVGSSTELMLPPHNRKKRKPDQPIHRS